MAIGALSALLFLPGTVYFLGETSSMSAGLALAAALIVAMRALRVPRAPSLDPLAPTVLLALTTLFLLSVHLGLRALVADLDYPKALASLVILFCVMLACSTLASIFYRASDRVVNAAFGVAMAIFVIAALFSIASIQPTSTTASAKSVFPFTEPSHFAGAFSPILGFMVVSSRGLRRWGWIFLGLALGYLLQSLTMIVAAMLISAVCLTMLRLLVFGAVGAAVLPFLDLGYFLARLQFDPTQTTNLSSLVYIQGWELVVASMRETWGWGLGFQQLGHIYLDAPTTNLIYRLTGGLDLNLNEGSFVAAKLISELGVFGVGLVAAHAYFAGRAFVGIRRIVIRKHRPPLSDVMAMCSIFTYSVEMFVRGTGYFSSSTVLMLTSIIILMRAKRNAAARADRSIEAS